MTLVKADRSIVERVAAAVVGFGLGIAVGSALLVFLPFVFAEEGARR